MYTMLWWKDARQFWPIWVFLALAAALVQGLLLHYLGRDARHGVLGISALICASLYAFATGAAAFAGERETGTLRLLDILSANRRDVWAAKVSFALVTTLALTLILVAMAAAFTDRWKPQGSLSISEALSFTTLVLVALGWSLFWSAILSNALTAAVTAIVCTGANLSFLTSRLDQVLYRGADLGTFVLWELAIFLVTLVASMAIFAQIIRGKWLRLEFRSPVVVNLPESIRLTRVQLPVQSPVATVLTAQPAVSISNAFLTNERPRRSWTAEAQAIAWQTIKEARKTWALLAMIELVALVLVILSIGRLDPVWPSLIGIVLNVVAGANVFGLENRARTQRFLTHHGAGAGLVWTVKLAVWTAGLALLWFPMIVLTQFSQGSVPFPSFGHWVAFLAVITFYPSVALLCGMAIRRGITAVVIAAVVGLIVTIPIGALVSTNMLPMEGLLVIPVGLLAVSWAWSGDWLFERPAPGRWVRLASLLVGMSSLAVSWYAAYRAWSIHDVGPIAPPASWSTMAMSALASDQNAAELYREAGHRFVGPAEDSPKFLESNRDLIELLKRAAARPQCRFIQPETLTVLDQLDLPPFMQFASLLTIDVKERQKHGDLAGAWDDIMVLFRMAHHVEEGTGFLGAFPTVQILESLALGQAMEWAVAPGQTPDRLHSALVAYRDLPKIGYVADMARAEANIVEKTLDLPTSALRDRLLEVSTENGPVRASVDSAMFDVATLPWERVRARRVTRLIASAVLEDTAREPWQRSHIADSEIAHAVATSRNAMLLIRNLAGYVRAFDKNEVGRRALVQILAIRSWQLQHGGQFPKKLDELVPTELTSLPVDPFSGREFRYIPSHGQDISDLRLALTPSIFKAHHAHTEGAWFLYSVGPDVQNDGGITFGNKVQLLDIVFEIPPVQASDGNGKARDAAKDRPGLGPPPAPAKPSI